MVEKYKCGCGAPRSFGQTDWPGKYFRRCRMELFNSLCGGLPEPITVLDVGGTVEFWKESGMFHKLALTLINVMEQQPLPTVKVIVGDACDLGRFADRSFDIVFSNSVLGHVGGWERQKQMAGEIRRVGQRYFVQTPNQRFPIDWRTLVPFFHWLSPSVQSWWLQTIPIGRYGRAANADEAMILATRVRNLVSREVQELFPEAEVLRERVLGFTKSFIAFHGFDSTHRAGRFGFVPWAEERELIKRQAPPADWKPAQRR